MTIQILILVDYGNHAKCRLPLGIDKADKESFGSLSTVTMSDGGKIVCLILSGNGPKLYAYNEHYRVFSYHHIDF